MLQAFFKLREAGIEEMGDEVKFIFKTLMKVPCMIFVMYFVMNIFFFFYVYFQVLGLSYVVMQSVVENNYLTKTEYDTLDTYIKDLNARMPMLEGSLGIMIDGSTKVKAGTPYGEIEKTGNALTRRQYGADVTCGVACDFKIIWPLLYNETTNDKKGVLGDPNGSITTGVTNFSGIASQEELKNRREDGNHQVRNNITITYKVPGLKYYPDMRI